MTRETKIGLLVGLAFIIIVGILLSEPLNHAGDAQPAPLPFAGANVRNGVTAPGAANTAPPITMQNNGSDAKQPVLTHDEVTKPQGGIQIVVGGASSNTPTSTPLSNSTDNEAAAPTHPNNGGATRGNEQANNGGHAAPPPPNVQRDKITQVAHDNGEEIVDLGTRPDSKPPVNNTKPKIAKQYQAVAGDTLSKIAQKFYGSSSKNYRDAIVAANASLKVDPNKIMNGQTYAIPAVETASVNTPPAAPTPAPTPVLIDNKTKPAASSEHFYTVKPGDNLWAIAREECGDAAAVSMLKELNKDALKGTDIVKAGMKLRLPGKPVASVN